MGGVNKIRGNRCEIYPAATDGALHRLLFGAFRANLSPFFLFKVGDAHEFFDGNLGTIRLIVAIRGTSTGQG